MSTVEERIAALGPRPPAIPGGKHAKSILEWERAVAKLDPPNRQFPIIRKGSK